MRQLNDYIYAGEDAIQSLSTITSDLGRIVLIVDETAFTIHEEYIMSNILCQHVVYKMKISEKIKNYESYLSIVDFLLENNVTRKDLICAIGGGVTTDITGFVASTYKRGIDFMFIPTTLLSHDSAVGGKNGVNYKGKNILGTINLPKYAIFDPHFYTTLSDAEIISGYAELVKHSILDDTIYLNELIENFKTVEDIKNKRLEFDYYLLKSIETKIAITDYDRYETFGKRTLLNFGHTFGHALEVASQYQVNHGQAIMQGIIFELFLSGFDVEDIYTYARDFGFEIVDYSSNEVFEAMTHDKKNMTANKITFINVTNKHEIFVASLTHETTKQKLIEFKSLLKELDENYRSSRR